MRPIGSLCVLALLAAGCGEEAARRTGSPPSEPFAELRVVVDRDGTGPGSPRELRLACASPRESAACAAAGELDAQDFHRPSGGACTDLFGGPQTARIEGRLRGKAVAGSYRRSNGCEIERWNAVKPLLDRAS